MSLRIDDRIGSKGLARLFAPYGIKPLVTRLEFGDLDFMGSGPHGLCAVCVERKTINDLVQSIQSNRLSGHQLPGMADQYDYGYLLVEGIWRPGKEGNLEVRGGQWGAPQRWGGAAIGMSYRAVDNYLTTLEVKTGMIFRRTQDDAETVAVVVDLLKWWGRPWDSHKSHDKIYAPAHEVEGHKLHLGRAKPNQVELVARTLRGVDDKAKAIGKAFGSVREMVLADEKAWLAIEGVGKVGARRIMEVFK